MQSKKWYQGGEKAILPALQGVSGAAQVVTPGRTVDEVQLPAIHAALNATRALPLAAT